MSSLALEAHCFNKLVSELVLFFVGFEMASAKCKVEKFDEKNSFSLWRVKIWALLVQQGLLKVLSGKDKLPEFMSDDVKEELEMKGHSAIQLCLDDEVLQEVADEDIAAGLLKLESLYMTKFLTNKLYLKQRLFTLRMKEGTPIKDHLDELIKILMYLKKYRC